MKNILYFILLSLTSYSQINNSIILSFKTGNLIELSKYINSNMELIINENEGVYSKSQSLVILKKFYDNNKVKNFIILHEGDSDETKYIIGELKTNKSTYRVYFLIKNYGELKKTYIHTLKIKRK